MARTQAASPSEIVVRAVRATQAQSTPIYSFFLPGEDLLRIAEISRLRRDGKGGLRGFQRRAIQNHISGIVKYVSQADVLFPNAVILALSPEVRFTSARGFAPEGCLPISTVGNLYLPVSDAGRQCAWIVDGQQRSLALARAKSKSLIVPVVGFQSTDIAQHREQFILVNKAKPLPQRLLSELLPEVDVLGVADLDAKRLPSTLCNLLNTDHRSPFYGLVKRPSDAVSKGVVTDTALIGAIRDSLASPLSSLAPLLKSGAGVPDAQGMHALLVAYWSAVRKAFPNAWGRPPAKSRLMHSAGIAAMTSLMDRILVRRGPRDDPHRHCARALSIIAPHCRWVSGRWESIDRNWDSFQNTPRDIQLLSNTLARLDHELTFGSTE